MIIFWTKYTLFTKPREKQLWYSDNDDDDNDDDDGGGGDDDSNSNSK